MVVGALYHCIDRDSHAPAGTQHAAKFRQAPHWIREEHQPRLHSTASKLSSENESACPSSTETEAFGALPRRSRAFPAMAGETSAAVTWPFGPTAARAAPAASPAATTTSTTAIPRAACRAGRQKRMEHAV